MKRTPGRHVSVAIRNLCIKLGKWDNEAEFDTTRGEFGCAFEDAIHDALVARIANSSIHYGTIIRPGEFEKDGLIGTPDLLDIDSWTPVEVKLTGIWSKHNIESTKFWHMWIQLKCYCHMLEARRGQLIIGHIGQWNHLGPEVNVWEDEWTDEELKNNWDMVRRYV